MPLVSSECKNKPTHF